MSDFFIDDTLFTVAVFDRWIIVTDKMWLNKLNCKRRLANAATSDNNQFVLLVSISWFSHVTKSAKATVNNRKEPCLGENPSPRYKLRIFQGVEHNFGWRGQFLAYHWYPVPAGQDGFPFGNVISGKNLFDIFPVLNKILSMYQFFFRFNRKSKNLHLIWRIFLRKSSNKDRQNKTHDFL